MRPFRLGAVLAAALTCCPPAVSAGAGCPYDCGDADGTVGIVDFLELLGQWGQIGTSCDVNGTGVGIVEFLALLADWGACPEPAGACCDGEGACSLVTAAACADLGGVFGGEGTDCTDGDGDRIPDAFELGDCAAASGCVSGTDPADPDTDNDGILDGDELFGTLAGLDLPAMGLDPCHADLLVETDWVYVTGQPVDWNKLHANQVARLVDAFAASGVANPDGIPGITLHIDSGQAPYGGGNALQDPDDNGMVDLSSFSFVAGEYFTIKAANFAANRHGYFHYAVMCDAYSVAGDYVNSSGLAELPGDDFLVSMGQWWSGDEDAIGTLFMHELGHNLVLRHGGYHNVNFKPNYNSVMNYWYSICGVDIDADVIPDGVLDYSHGTAIPLDESALVEAEGVTGAGPGIDWNTDGDAADELAWNINCRLTDTFANSDCNNHFQLSEPCGVLGACYDSFCGTLSDWNDWAAIQLDHLDESDFAPAEVIHCVNGPGVWVFQR